MSAPIVVVAFGREWELTRGELVIGRDPCANIVLNDPLVSRLHARITISLDGQVVFDDLQSANGVFVNGIKLSRPSVLLSDGDRLLIGTTEVSVFSMRSSTTVVNEPLVPRSPQMPTVLGPHFPETFSESAEPRISPRRAVAVTSRSDAIDLVGQFAEQLMDSGHPLEAVRALSEHLQNLMKGASAGLTVPTRILDGATRYALKLYNWTQRNTWLDYVFELHLASLQVPSKACINELESFLSTTPGLETALIAYFIKTIERRHDPLTPDEVLRLRRIERLGTHSSTRPPPVG